MLCGHPRGPGEAFCMCLRFESNNMQQMWVNKETCTFV